MKRGTNARDDARNGAAGSPPRDKGSYPYGSKPLTFAWTDGTARALAAVAVLSANVATAARPFALATIDDWALRVLFPASLAVVLSFAPRPATLTGRIAKDLTVVAIVAAIFTGRFVPLMIACFPMVLALAVVLGETSLGRRLWDRRL